MTNLPADGARIVFDVVPFGSYATAGVPYLVGRSGNTLHLTNAATGSGTFDPAWRYRNAAWRQPPLKAGERATLDASEGRYFIETEEHP